MLYLREDCETTPRLHESITTLYTAILVYLAKAKTYFSGNTLSMWTIVVWRHESRGTSYMNITNSISPERIGRGLVDMMSKQYDELWARISEIEVEKWIKMVDAERKLLSVQSHKVQLTLYKFNGRWQKMSAKVMKS
jgi:hypothetical protein